VNSTIKVFVKNVWGNERYYPANDQAFRFASLVGQATLTGSQIKTIMSMGFTLETTAAPSNLDLGGKRE
jgi:hypothetical protein